MSYLVLTPSDSSRLTTVEAVYEDTRDSRILEESSLVGRMIDQASDAITRWCGRPLAQQRYEVHSAPSWQPILVLPVYPIVSVESMLAGETTLTSGVDYRIHHASAGELFRWPGWGIGYPWGDAWVWGTGSWTIPEFVATAICGFMLPEQTNAMDPTGPLLPGYFERACIETTKIWFTERAVDTRVRSRHLGDQTITYEYDTQSSFRAIPRLAMDLLASEVPWVVR